jgi:hypothetical protein
MLIPLSSILFDATDVKLIFMALWLIGYCLDIPMFDFRADAKLFNNGFGLWLSLSWAWV